MTFASLSFLGFVVAVYLLYFYLSSRRQVRLWVLTIASIIFYGAWSWRFIPFLIGTGAIDYYIAKAIAGTQDRKRARMYLTASIVLNVGVLVVFKYLDFFLSSTEWLAHRLGFSFAVPLLHLTVPLGISFYTFQSMSYTLDVYRGTFKPKSSFLEFVASLTFFPHLLAGPIVRSSFLLPQFTNLLAPTWQMAQRGLVLFGAGLTKKVSADLLARTVDSIYQQSTAGPIDGIAAWTATLSFSAQVYGDFAGYTDMARGVAAFFGFELPNNFNLPFLATSPSDYWRRWHISLTTWFRDYLYYPLALGPLKGHPYINVGFVIMVAGIWHGAGWKYVVFGLYHGILLGGTLWLGSLRKRRVGAAPTSLAVRLLSMFATFYALMIAQVIFRSTTGDSLKRLLMALHGMGKSVTFGREAVVRLAFAVATVIGGHLLDYLVLHRRGGLKGGIGAWVFFVVTITFAILFHGVGEVFIYFQF